MRFLEEDDLYTETVQGSLYTVHTWSLKGIMYWIYWLCFRAVLPVMG